MVRQVALTMQDMSAQAHPPRTTTGAIRIRNVTKIYDPEGVNIMAVDDCSMEITPGEFCMIVGPSGCGKTTLLNAIAGFHSITSGQIFLDHKLLCGPGKPIAAQGADRIVVFQNGALFPWKTLAENVAYGPMVQGVLSRRNALEKAHEMLAEAGLGEFGGKYPGEVSSGMARRAEIVRALINKPKVLLLDEPYRAMDGLTKSIMHFITHDLEEAIFLGDRVHVLTTRPCRLKKVVNVDIPRPRNYEVLSSEQFRLLVEETRDAVHEEAIKAFQSGERELA
jgi:NitT/TauT family transport system ATP-binding protein